MASLKRTAIVEVQEACRAVLSAAETCLLLEGLELPAARYVSIQAGDWLAGTCEDCCSQLVVTPLMEITRFNDPTTVAAGALDARQAQARLVTYEVNLSAGVNLDVLGQRLTLGDVSKPYSAGSNQNSHWSESVPILAARWALVRHLEKQVRAEMCAAGFSCNFSVLGTVTPWLEGGCAGTKVTVQVQQ